MDNFQWSLKRCITIDRADNVNPYQAYSIIPLCWRQIDIEVINKTVVEIQMSFLRLRI